MFRIGLALCFLFLFSCKSKKTSNEENGFSYEKFTAKFRSVSLPYQLSDTGLLRNKDTTTLKSTELAQFIPPSTLTKWFGKGKVKYIVMAKFPPLGNLTYYIVKAVSGSKKIALLVVFDKNQFGSVFPFLVPDDNPTTSQISSIDRAYSITKIITQGRVNDVAAEGKEVYEYNADAKKFTLILTNPLSQKNALIINPIDTLPRKHKFAADYIKDKRNFVSIRDGRYPNQLLVYIHMEKNNGECTGDLKGDLLLTSSTAAIYRLGGDPCVLSFRFSSSSITIKEDEGCGSHRGVDCVFDGTFQRKKPVKVKQAGKKSSHK